MTRFSRFFFSFFITAIAASAGAAGTSETTEATEPTDLVATYESGEIRADEFRSWLRYRGLEDDPSVWRDEVEELILTKTLSDAAQESGAATRDHLPLKIRHSQNRLISKWYERHLADSVEVPEEEIQRALIETPEERFARPHRVKLANLFLRVPDDASGDTRGETRRRAEALREKIAAGLDFTEAAKAESDSANAVRGGYIGWVDPGTLREGVRDAAKALEPRRVSPVIETPDGFTLLFAHEVQEAHTPLPAERRELLEAQLRGRIASERIVAFRQRMADSMDLEIDGEALRSGDLDAVVVRSAGGDFTLGMLKSFSRGEDFDEVQLRDKMSKYLLHTMAAEHARAEGFHEQEELDERLRWIRRASEARAELEERAGKRIGADGAADPRELAIARKEVRQDILRDLEVGLISTAPLLLNS